MKSILSLRRILILLCLHAIALFTLAQKSPQEVEALKKQLTSNQQIKDFQISEERKTPSFIAMKKGGQVNHPAQAKSFLTQALGLRAGIDELKEVRVVKTSADVSVIEFHQYYKGIKVEHSRYTAMVKNGNISFFNGAYFDVPASLSLSPKMPETAALGKAKENVKARKYAWENVQEIISRTKDLGTKAALHGELNEYLPKGELVVVKDFTKEGMADMRLAYKFNIYASEPISRAWIYIDAENGNTLLIDKIIKHVDNPGRPFASSVTTTVTTRYAGSRQIYTKQISGNDPNSGVLLVASNPTELYSPGSATHGLIDDTRGSGVETYDLNAVGGLPLSLAPAYAQAKSFTDVDNNWTLTEHKRSGPAENENDDIAWDAHWGAGVVYDYWKQKHNRLSFDGNNAKIRSYVHSGTAYDNAFWNGRVMTYGDGSYPAPGGFRPLTSLDVCAHEIGHGVCTFTSDLVYAKESGAMNEGFSDIWAACAEYFAVKQVDGSLATSYKPFSIGEQIAADPARPLRRMDDPKAERDPDTYGGQFWRNPECTPSLANDQCGVHTNSGVLNKWFYLITVGSGAGSGPDASFAGKDDGINDKGNAYSVTGLGFALSEQITYLTELLLTSTAKFAEARAVSIQVAADLSGNPCGDMVKTVTNAWYAVNVGTAFVEPCKITYGFVQPGSSVSEGVAGAGCAAEKEIKIPLLMPANSSGTVSVAGTAANGTDYRLGSTSLSNTLTTSKLVNILVYVKNDGVVEPDETVDITITLTNVGTNLLANKHKLNIIEDDVVPTIGNGVKSLLNNITFDNEPSGFASPASWTEKVETPGANKWGVWNGQLQITAEGQELAPGTYDGNSPTSTVITPGKIDARGLSNLKIKFDFEVAGEVDPNGINPDEFGRYDYMAVVYSLDGGQTFLELNVQEGFGQFAAAAPTSGTFEGTLPSYLNNKEFLLGFRWYNDPLVSGVISVRLDNINLQGSPRKIENDLNHNSRENLNAGQDVYFYSLQDGEVLGRVKNGYTKTYGCTNLFVEKAGTGAFNLYQSNTSLHKVADKILRIETGFIYKASTTVTLYFTEQQLLNLEAATGFARTAFSVYRVDATAYTGATNANTKKYTPVFTPLPGVGGYYTITFSDKANGSYALGATVSSKGTERAASLNTEEMAARWKFANLYPNPASNNANFVITAPEQQRVSIEIVNVSGQLMHSQTQVLPSGKTQVNLEVGRLTNGSYILRVRNTEGQVLNSQSFIKK